jgi:hypothetical protein
MSQWGVLYEDTGECHVAPVLPDGRLALHHALHEFCPCGPKPQLHDDKQIWVHQDAERGGFDS